MRTSISILAFLVLVGCATSRPAANAPVVDLTGPAGSLPQTSDELCGKILLFPAGARIPLVVEARTPFLHTESTGPSTEIVFDRTIYVWLWGREPLFSYDRCRWMSTKQMGEGNLRFGVGRETGAACPCARVSLDLGDTPPPVRTWAGG